MSLKTRLDERSKENSLIYIKDASGIVVATIKSVHSHSITLDISTNDGFYIEKPSGWNSKTKHKLT